MREVAVDIQEDGDHLYGHALARFAAAIDPSAPVAVRIGRLSTDAPYLGQTGWQARPASFPVAVVGRSADSTILLLGPEICDQLRYDEQIRIEIEGAGIVGKTAFWPDVARTPSKGGSDIVGGKSKTKPTDEITGTRPPSPPEPWLPPPPPEGAASPVDRKEGKTRRRGLWPLLLLLLLVAAVLGAAYYYRPVLIGLFHHKPSAKTFAQRYEELKKAGDHAHDLFQLCNEAYAGGDSRSGFLACDLASQRGDVDAALQIARWYDPRSFDPSKFQHPDANNAALYYSRLAPHNDTAAQLLTSLCTEAANPNSPYFEDFQNFLRRSYCP
jgi:hypothetical protein